MSPHRFPAGSKESLRNEQRNRFQPAEGIIQRMELSSNEVTADLGCGTGYITLPLAPLARTVVAMDSQDEMLVALMLDASEEEQERIMPVKGEMPRLPFADRSLDRVIMVNVVHEVEDKPLLASEVYRVLRREGRASIVDFQKRETSFGPPVDERMTEDEMISFFSSFRAIARWSFHEFYQLELQAG